MVSLNCRHFDKEINFRLTENYTSLTSDNIIISGDKFLDTISNIMKEITDKVEYWYKDSYLHVSQDKTSTVSFSRKTKCN